MKALYALVCLQGLNRLRPGTTELEVSAAPVTVAPRSPLGKFDLPALPRTQQEPHSTFSPLAASYSSHQGKIRKNGESPSQQVPWQDTHPDHLRNGTEHALCSDDSVGYVFASLTSFNSASSYVAMNEHRIKSMLTGDSDPSGTKVSFTLPRKPPSKQGG